jgi:hypothetical protein
MFELLLLRSSPKSVRFRPSTSSQVKMLRVVELAVLVVVLVVVLAELVVVLAELVVVLAVLAAVQSTDRLTPTEDRTQ